MDFKNAASAAQAAAESAEMASMAARAAAELATRESFSRDNSTIEHDERFSESSESESDDFVHETVPISPSTGKKYTSDLNPENKNRYIDETMQSNRRQNSISDVPLPHFDDDGTYDDDHIDYRNFTYEREYRESQASDIFNQERMPISPSTGEKNTHEVNSLNSGIKDHYVDGTHGTMLDNTRQNSIRGVSLPHFDDDGTYDGDQLDFDNISNHRENLEKQESQFISKSSSSSNQDAKIDRKYSLSKDPNILNAEYDTDPEDSEETCADLLINETNSERFPSELKTEKLNRSDNESEHVLWTKPLSGGLRNRILPSSSHTRSELSPESTETYDNFSSHFNLPNQRPSNYLNSSTYSESYSNSFEDEEDKSDWNQTRRAKGFVESNQTSFSVGSDLIKKTTKTNYPLIPDNSEAEKGKAVTSQEYKLSHPKDSDETNRASSVKGTDLGVKNTGYNAKLMADSFEEEDDNMVRNSARSREKDSVHSNLTSNAKVYFSRNNDSLMSNESPDNKPSTAKGSPISKQHRKVNSVSSEPEAPYQDQRPDDYEKSGLRNSSLYFNSTNNEFENSKLYQSFSGNNTVNVKLSRRTRPTTSTQSKFPANRQSSEFDKSETHEDILYRKESSNIRSSNIQTQKAMKGSPSSSGSTSPKRRGGMFGRPTNHFSNENSVSESSDDSEAPQFDADRISYSGKKDKQKSPSSTKNVIVDPNTSQNNPEQMSTPKAKESQKSTEASEGSKHVHPKLPDSDNLISYFQSLRSDRRK